ncbi:MAG: penicillin-binding protein 1A, partial [Limisphaerales bacterium]
MTILTQFRKEIKSKPGKASLRLAFQLGIRFALLGIVMLFLFISAVWIGAFGALPGKKALERIHHDNASLVYASDGSLIGKYYLENRHSIPVSSLPTHLLDALIAIEDVRFFEHSGVDYRSLGRVLVYTILLNKTEYGGGSTLSQQLAKNLYKRKAYGKLTIPVAKAKEIMIASRLEKVYDKKELLELYLNTVPFGENVYGIEAAALRFYSKKASDLSLEEGAVLIGLLKANTTYNPRLHPETSTKRRNVVLTQMYKYGYLDSLTYQKSLAEKIKLNYTELGRHNGTAPYFRDQVLRECKSILADLEILDGQSYNPYADGLKIYTTLDPKLQQYAEYAVREHMAKLQKQFQRDRGSKLSTGELSRAVKSTERYKRLVAVGVDEKQINAVFSTSRKMELFTWEGSKVMDLSPLDSVKYVTALMQIGFLAADPLSGHVLSWVGGIDHRKFGYDHVRARRQAGSTFKPVVFAAALESGQTPCDFISASRESYPDYNDWSPRNAGGKYEGYWSMSGALASSVNTVAVKVFMETGTNEVLNTARNLGFTGD